MINEKEENSMVASPDIPTVEPLELSETVQRLVEYYFGEEE